MDFETELDGYRQALMALKGLEFVDPNKVIIFGHSMGGVMGPLLGRDPGQGDRGLRDGRQDVARIHTGKRPTSDGSRRVGLRRDRPHPAEGGGHRSLHRGGPVAHRDRRPAPRIERTGRGAIRRRQVPRRDALRVFPPARRQEPGRGLAEVRRPDPGGLGQGRLYLGRGRSRLDRPDHRIRAHPATGCSFAIDGIDHGFYRASSQEDSFKSFRKPGREYNPVFLDALRDWASKVVRE